MSAQLIPVSFRGDDLSLIDHNGEPYVAMKPVVEGIGLDWKSQHRKLQEGRFQGFMVEMTMQLPGDMQRRKVVCVPLRKLSGWLMTIHPNRVSPQIKNRIIAYQNECDDALWDYWNQGFAVNKRAANDEFAQGAIREFQATKAEVLDGIVKVNAAIMQLGGAYGLEGNQLLLYANKAVEKQTGIAPIELLGITGLVNEAQELHYTATELGRKYGMTANQMNKLLAQLNLQRNFEYAPRRRRWELTPEGKQHGVILDTAKRHSDGTPVQQIRWKESVLKLLRDYADKLMNRAPSLFGERLT